MPVGQGLYQLSPQSDVSDVRPHLACDPGILHLTPKHRCDDGGFYAHHLIRSHGNLEKQLSHAHTQHMLLTSVP